MKFYEVPNSSSGSTKIFLLEIVPRKNFQRTNYISSNSSISFTFVVRNVATSVRYSEILKILH